MDPVPSRSIPTTQSPKTSTRVRRTTRLTARLCIRPDALARTEAFGPVDHSGAGLHRISFNSTLYTKPLLIGQPVLPINLNIIAPNCVLARKIQLSLVCIALNRKENFATCPKMQWALVRRCFVPDSGFGRVELQRRHQIKQNNWENAVNIRKMSCLYG
jgi:hypothetical protein